MRISKVRNYISQQIKLIEPKMEQWKEAFNTANVPSTKYGKAYHIFYSISSATRNQTTETITISATITFFFKSHKSELNDFDEAMETVNQIALNCMSQDAIYNFRTSDDFPIQSVSRNSQSPQAQNTNDNSILIPLELSLDIIQTIC